MSAQSISRSRRGAAASSAFGLSCIVVLLRAGLGLFTLMAGSSGPRDATYAALFFRKKEKRERKETHKGIGDGFIELHRSMRWLARLSRARAAVRRFIKLDPVDHDKSW